LSVISEAKNGAFLLLVKRRFSVLKKKLIALLLTLVMVMSVLPMAVFAEEEPGDGGNEVPSPAFSILKMVNDDEKTPIVVWLKDEKELSDADIIEVLSGITFELYSIDSAGDVIDKVDGITGRIDAATSKIVFTYDDSEVTDLLGTGWYRAKEILTGVALEFLLDNGANLDFYYNSTTGAVSSNAGLVYDEDTTFTIQQFRNETRPLQALYRDADGVVRYLRNSPALAVPNRPNNGGGALGTSRFEATQDNGYTYMSFCADIGATGVLGKYHVDEANHGFTDEQMQNLVAVLDFIYDRSGFTEYEDIALAQLAVWNLILEYTDDPMVADYWLREIATGLLYKDAWGELFKIEGYNNVNGTNYWYTPEYKALIDDIIAEAYSDKYFDLYVERIAAGAEVFVGSAYFLKGDLTTLNASQRSTTTEEGLNLYQQRQLMIEFYRPPTFDNLPDNGGKQGQFGLEKMVLDDGEKVLIAEWLFDKVLDLDEVEAILSGITFYLHNSNSDGDDLGKIPGVTGKIDLATSLIFFSYDFSGNTYTPPTGWYLVSEEISGKALEYFKTTVPPLLIYYNAATGVITANQAPEIDADVAFTITQFKSQSRPLQALYRDEDGNINYLRNAPALDVPNRPNNGGGALGTSRFEATQDNGDTFMSFCADIGATGVLGKYYIDEKNHGFTDEQMLSLVAALDFIYARGGFADYEDIALAQLVVWNLILEYTDEPMVADLWLRNITSGLLYTEAWGELFKIEGYNNTNGTNYWYTPDYKALINDIIAEANTSKYVDIYMARIAAGADKYVCDAYFLKGDVSTLNANQRKTSVGELNLYQQRQLMIVFNEGATFDNEPEDGGEIEIAKMVAGEDQLVLIVNWLTGLFGYTDIDDIMDNDDWDTFALFFDILEGIRFEISKYDEDADEFMLIDGVLGEIDPYTSMVIFYDEDYNTYKFTTGLYMIHELLDGEALDYFLVPVDDLVIYFNAGTKTISGANQREPVIINDPVIVRRYGDIEITKVVLVGNETVGITSWLFFDDGWDMDDAIEFVENEITFEIYESNAAGDELDKLDGVTGKVDGASSLIKFYDDDDEPYKFDEGWYLIREVMTDAAKAVFKDSIPDLLVYGYFDPVTDIWTVTGVDGSEGTPEFVNVPVDEDTRLVVVAKVVAKEPVYEVGSISGTMVTWRNNGTIPGGTWNNGMTYVDVNIAEASTDEGIWFQIADSSPSNRPSGLWYNVKVADGMLTVSFADGVTIPNDCIGIVLSAVPFVDRPTSELKHDNVLTKSLPAGTGDTVYLYFHSQGRITWITDNLIGWKDVPYKGKLTLDVAGPDGFVYKDEDFNGSYLLYPAAPGEYTVTLSGDGFAMLTQTVTVDKNATVTVDFGTITVTY